MMSKRPKSLLEADEPALQLSSNQLVLVICALLLLALGVFLLGMWARSYEMRLAGVTEPESLPGETVPAAAPEILAVPPEDPPAPPPAPAAAGEQRSPAPSVLREAQRKSQPHGPREVRLPVDVPAPPPGSAAGDSIPPLARSGISAPAEQPAAAPASRPVTESPAPSEAPPSNSAVPVPSPPSAPASSPIPSNDPVEIPAPAPASAPVAPVAPAPVPAMPPAAVPSPAAAGRYAIQVAALSASDMKNVEAFRARVESISGLPTRLVKTADGRYYRIVAGSFPERPAASEACNALKARGGDFKDCFVQQY